LNNVTNCFNLFAGFNYREKVGWGLRDEQIQTHGVSAWSNLPIIMVQPAGLLIKDMTDETRRAAHALMQATMSSQGYAKFKGNDR
jgi:hypothetical protein